MEGSMGEWRIFIEILALSLTIEVYPDLMGSTAQTNS